MSTELHLEFILAVGDERSQKLRVNNPFKYFRLKARSVRGTQKKKCLKTCVGADYADKDFKIR